MEPVVVSAWQSGLTGTVSVLAIAVFLGAVFYGGVRDVLSMIIPNHVSLVVCGAFVAAAAVGTWSPTTIFLHCVTAGTVFLGGVVLFRYGILGGGDVKLLASSALWIGPGALPMLLLVVSLYGGLLSALLLGGRRLPARFKEGHPVVARLLSQSGGVPYGIAIAAGVVTVFLGLHIAPAPG